MACVSFLPPPPDEKPNKNEYEDLQATLLRPRGPIAMVLAGTSNDLSDPSNLMKDGPLSLVFVVICIFTSREFSKPQSLKAVASYE